jgi:hypothetical protein
MEKPDRPAMSPRGELEPREQIDSLQVGFAERAQITDKGSRHVDGHLKIDRPATEKSSPGHR